ncbi:MAG TPA: amidohydrolase family protein [Solimonas sp.]|nr:amidohydrolase family protein [Solimonas sp.]
MAVIIDAWIQHPTLRFIEQPMFDSLRRWVSGSRFASDARGDSERPAMDGRAGLAGEQSGRARDGEVRPEKEPARDVPIEFTLGALQAAGISRALVSAWHGPMGELISNDEVAGFVARSRGMLLGVGSVNLARPLEAVREVRRCVRELGFKAIRVLPWLWNLPPNDRRYYPVYAECCEQGVPFCLQVGHTGPLCPSEPGRPIPYLDEVALDFPELVIVGGHIGFPWTQEMISLATKYPNVYIDTSAYTAKRYPPELVAYLRGHGRRKVLFGSNYPMIAPADCLKDLDALQLDAETRELFLAGNAQRVFRL